MTIFDDDTTPWIESMTISIIAPSPFIPASPENYISYFSIIPDTGIIIQNRAINRQEVQEIDLIVEVKNAFQLINRNKMAAIAQTTFSNKFSWMKMYQFRLRFHWNLFLRFESTILVQIMAWRRPGDKPLSEPMVFYLTDAYMRHSASVS